MADRHDEAHRTPVERLGLTAVARSLGSAVASVRRLVPALRFKRVAPPGRPGALLAFEASRQRLRAEIAELESELERLHSLITSSAVVSDARPGAERPTVDALLAKSRQLRDRLHEKRYRLARVERSIARERRLAAMTPSGPPPEPKPGRGRVRPEAPTRAAARDERNDPRVRAIFRAVDKALFENRTAKLEFKRLAERLVDTNPNVRREAVNRLGEVEHPAAFDLLLVAVGDPNERVRLAALNGLGGMSRAAPADLFRSFLHDRNSSLRLAALRGLASMGSGALAVTELTAAIEDADPAVRKTAATVLGWHRSKGKAMGLVFPALSLALRDEEEGVRIAAAEALGSLCDARAVLPLIRALTDASPRVCQEAMRALRNTAGEEVDLIGQDLDAEARATALKTWWADARVHVVVGQGGAAAESDAPLDDLEAAADAPALDDESGEDFERLTRDEPSEPAPPPARERADAAAAKSPAPAAPKESAPGAAAPAPAPKQAAPAAAPKEPAPAPAPIAPAAEPASAKPDAAPEFENLFPDGGAAAVGEGEGEGEGEGDEASGDGDYEDPFGGGS